jgi:ferredoxin--NADP+ reductase
VSVRQTLKDKLVMAAWIEGRVAGKRHWTASLFSLQVTAPEVTFTAGQFGRIALPAPPEHNEPMIGRPYSFVNPPDLDPHEFYFIVVDEGPLSPRLAALEVGDPVWLAPRANGFFSVGEVPATDVLWCLSTGTGIGPFLSMLRTAQPWGMFERVVLVHAVRHAEELTYQQVIADIGHAHAGAFTYVPMVSRDTHPGALAGRIPAAIADGRLESRTGLVMSPENSHAMLCGNPAMVDDTQKLLATRGMRRHRRREPGHVTVETYW